MEDRWDKIAREEHVMNKRAKPELNLNDLLDTLIAKWEKNMDEIKIGDGYDRIAQREIFYTAEILKDLRKLANQVRDVLP